VAAAEAPIWQPAGLLALLLHLDLAQTMADGDSADGIKPLHTTHVEGARCMWDLFNHHTSGREEGTIRGIILNRITHAFLIADDRRTLLPIIFCF
jgi:hypothetical protein